MIMSKNMTLCLIGTMLSIQLFSQQISNEFFFDKGSGQLQKNERSKLSKWISVLDLSEIKGITLESYCDADGSRDFNLSLAADRNTEVINLFPNEFKPLIKQTTSVGEVGMEEELETIKKENRKVIITIQLKEKQTEGINQELTSLWEELKPKSQNFCIDPTRDTILVLNEGSIIRIESFSFQQNDTPITEFDDCLFLVIDEVLSKKVSYLNSLTTQSNQSIIESAGMLNINAEYKNNPAYLIKDKEMLVMLPTQQTSVGDFQMFSGDRDPHSNEMNWLADNNPELKNISLNDFFTCGGIENKDGNGIYCKFFFCKIKRFFFPKKYKI